LRDRLVVWLTKHGQPTMKTNGMFIVEASVGEFEILYRTPFTRLPTDSRLVITRLGCCNNNHRRTSLMASMSSIAG
jgi:hypothetical protein